MDNGSEWTMASVAQAAIEVGLAVARETGEIESDEAAKKLTLLRSKMNEIGEAQAPIASIADVEIDGEHVSFADIVEFYRVGKQAEREAIETATAEEPDPVSEEIVALEALMVVEAYISARAKAIPVEAQEPSTETTGDVVVEVSEEAAPIEEPLIEFDEGDAEPGELEESGDGAVLAIVEDGDGTRAAPMKLHVVPIEPGMGNAKMNRYYSPAMLRENAHKFKGAKMYPVNHRGKDKSVGNEVSLVLDCPVGFTASGGPIALVGVFDEAFARNVRNRAALNALGSLECSILGEGKMRKGKVNGKEAYIVEAIDTVESIDWVTRAGAGGRALEIVENQDGGGEDMESNVQNEPVVEVQPGAGTAASEQPPDVTIETEGEVQEMMIAEAVAETVNQASLPDVFKDALKAREYEDKTTLAEAIKKAVEDYKAATGSGRPFGQGQPRQRAIEESDETPMERKVKRHKRILAEVGYKS